jgi:hypothetical protein
MMDLNPENCEPKQTFPLFNTSGIKKKKVVREGKVDKEKLHMLAVVISALSREKKSS